ncbi:transcriptional regulator [Chryseobacterium sp. HMWF035]|uniref:transcriptional regulator n=1 Tax=Chryseobacterium sp. HMWF035 TaxID=2056868 RepID=UPI000D56C3A3|nr:transcriptional regulator [Chryseobacterium sp. HMWF035]PVV61805.1 transcriptional regulator [Chryseobacterium sp. HMWF035]
MSEGKIVELIISEIDLFIIDRVRELRGRMYPYISQVELSQRMGFADGYVGKVENFSSNARYNIRKLHLLAFALNKSSYKDFLPDTILSTDLLYLKIEVNRQKNDKVQFDKENNIIKNYKILDKRPLNEVEIKAYNNRRKKTL